MDNLSFFKITNDVDSDMFGMLKLKNTHFLSAYYQEYYKDKVQDLTFGILHENKVSGYVLCYELDKKLCLPNDGVKIILLEDNSKETSQTYKKTLDHILLLAKQNLCTEIVIQDKLLNGELSSLGIILFNNKYHAKITFEMLIEYENFNEIFYRKNLRKSYKSLINWGKNNLEIKIINNNNQLLEEFLNFKNFHLKISGRQTRSDDSWMIQYKMIQHGFGELILAYYQEKLVAGSLFTDQDDVSIYFTGAYERDLFEFGISHYLLYQGICRSYARGNASKFSLGYFDTDIKDSKFYNIQFFKKGFCEKLVPTILWSLFV